MNRPSNWDDKYRDDPRSNEELIDLVLHKDADVDDEEYWHPIGSLQHRLPLIATRIDELLISENDKSREAAATIFGQNRCSSKWDVPRCVNTLLAAASRETASRPLAAMLHALGHLHDERSIPAIVAFRKHQDCDVRYAATNALAGYDDDQAIQALIELSADSDFDVRNWATFNLGSMIDADTASICEALVARLAETDDEIIGEAIVGLSRRGDVRAIPPLLAFFDNLSVNVLRDWTLVQEAVEAITDTVTQKPDPAWSVPLQRAKSLGLGDPEKIQSALGQCAPLK